MPERALRLEELSPHPDLGLEPMRLPGAARKRQGVQFRDRTPFIHATYV